MTIFHLIKYQEIINSKDLKNRLPPDVWKNLQDWYNKEGFHILDNYALYLELRREKLKEILLEYEGLL